MQYPDILKKIIQDEEIREFFQNFGDFEPYDAPKNTFDLDGEMQFNMKGVAFGCSGDGSDFLLLDDGTVGLNGSEGAVGRIAENIEDFFSLLLNFPCFWDYMSEEIYLDENRESFQQHLAAQMEEQTEGWDYEKIRTEVSEKLGIPIDTDVVNHTAQKFYQSVTRTPRFGYSYQGEHYDDLFEGDCY